MRVQASQGGANRDGVRAAAFSLAEMMIALIILGFGLLVVGAALPVGLTYTRATIDQATGDAAVEYGLDVIETHIRLTRDPWIESPSPPGPPYLAHYSDVFRPRANGSNDPPNTSLGEFLANYEPLIKVRPLLAVSIDATPGANFGNELPWPPQVNQPTPSQDIEERIATWLNGAPSLLYKEYDDYNQSVWGAWVAPALPSVAIAYPPISPDSPWLPTSFYSNPPNSMYQLRPVTGPGTSGSETLKALDRSVAWTAFYRRASYLPGSDPNLYEVIVVATRLPVGPYRYPRFVGNDPFADSGTGGAPAAVAVTYKDHDTPAPVPWLVVFDELPLPPTYDLNPERTLVPNAAEPSRLRFLASADVGVLLPPGSILIPAVNDERPSAIPNQTLPPLPPVRLAGFVPHAPDALPIFEVDDRVERLVGGELKYEIMVKHNGFYPWTGPNDPVPRLWPVWIIPPAFKALDQNLNPPRPLYENRSPIVAVGRRFVRLREIP